MNVRYCRREVTALTLGLLLFAGCGSQPPAAKEAAPISAEELAKKRARFVSAKLTVRYPAVTLPAFRKWGVRETAADALARIGEDAVAPLTQTLRDPDPLMRLSATRALARMGSTALAAVPALTQALGDSDESVRQGAARALGQVGPEAREAIPALIESMRPSNKDASASASVPTVP